MVDRPHAATLLSLSPAARVASRSALRPDERLIWAGESARVATMAPHLAAAAFWSILLGFCWPIISPAISVAGAALVGYERLQPSIAFTALLGLAAAGCALALAAAALRALRRAIVASPRAVVATTARIVSFDATDEPRRDVAAAEVAFSAVQGWKIVETPLLGPALALRLCPDASRSRKTRSPVLWLPFKGDGALAQSRLSPLLGADGEARFNRP